MNNTDKMKIIFLSIYLLIYTMALYYIENYCVSFLNYLYLHKQLSSMAKTSTKLKRWSHLDQLLAAGTPVSMFDIYMSYLSHPDKDISLIPDVTRVQKLPRDKQLEKFEQFYNATLRKDLDIFKKALISHGKEDMLVVGKGAEDKKYEDGKDRRTKTYCYREPGFSVMPFLTAEMSDAEYKKLASAINKLKGVLSEQNFEEIKFVLQSRIEADYNKGENCVEYEDNRRLKGREYRPIIYNAILEKTSLQILYTKFDGEIIGPFEFHPYLLKQYNDRWYAFGFRPDANNFYYSIPLDRISSKPKIIGKYNEDRPIGYKEHFNNIVGVTKYNRKEQLIEILIKDIDAWGRITTKPLPTQQIISDFDAKSNTGRITLRLIPNNELYTKILSWGRYVEIIKPISVRDRLIELINSIRKEYH